MTAELGELHRRRGRARKQWRLRGAAQVGDASALTSEEQDDLKSELLAARADAVASYDEKLRAVGVVAPGAAAAPASEVGAATTEVGSAAAGAGAGGAAPAREGGGVEVAASAGVVPQSRAGAGGRFAGLMARAAAALAKDARTMSPSSGRATTSSWSGRRRSAWRPGASRTSSVGRRKAICTSTTSVVSRGACGGAGEGEARRVQAGGRPEVGGGDSTG